MRRIGIVAGREFLAAVGNRGFVIGLLIMPAIVAGLTVLMPRLTARRGEPIRGQLAVIDQTGVVLAGLREALTPEAVARRREEAAARALANAPAIVRDAAGSSVRATERVLGAPLELEIVERPATADLEAEKRALAAAPTALPRRSALVVIRASAVRPEAGSSTYSSYEIYVRPDTDDRVEPTVYDGLREAILDARLRLSGMDRAATERLLRVDRAGSVTITAAGEQATSARFRFLVPFAFAGLLVFAIMIAGQTLLTSTIEEKSSRVIEVLLSTMSPFELMAGKILGQMAVSMLVLALYVAAGFMLLASFAMGGLVSPLYVVYLAVFFVISYLVFAAAFAAVGATVNETREAQALITPVMLLLVAPWLLGPSIARDPNSTLSVVLSFLPPVNTFAMMIRLASTSPPPAWHVAVTIVIGLASAVAMTWLAAKVFKVALLMHGKPPNFSTLLRWVKQA